MLELQFLIKSTSPSMQYWNWHSFPVCHFVHIVLGFEFINKIKPWGLILRYTFKATLCLHCKQIRMSLTSPKWYSQTKSGLSQCPLCPFEFPHTFSNFISTFNLYLILKSGEKIQRNWCFTPVIFILDIKILSCPYL